MKYRLRLDLSIVTEQGITLYRIERLSNQELGGYIQSESNLSQFDDAWVSDDAQVYGNARILGDAQVYGNARVYGDAQVYGNALVYGNARVYGDAWVYGNARVYGDAQVSKPKPTKFPLFRKWTIFDTRYLIKNNIVLDLCEYSGLDNTLPNALEKMKSHGGLRKDIQAFRHNQSQLVINQKEINGIIISTIGGTYMEPNLFMKYKKQRKTKILNEEKKPISRLFHIGVEIEFLSDSSPQQLKDAFIENGLEHNVNLGTDGSVSNLQDISNCDGGCCEGHNDCDDCDCNCNCGPDNGYELRVIGDIFNIHSIIEKVCSVLEKHNAYVNRTCGLHVHLDMRNRLVDKAYHNLVIMQPLLYSMCPKSRFNNNYCKPQLSKRKNIRDRYYGINGTSYARHKTIEVRIHSGTVQAEKINNWISLLLGIVNKAKLSKYPSDIQKTFRLSTGLTEYIEKRVAKFEHSENTFKELNTRFDQIRARERVLDFS